MEKDLGKLTSLMITPTKILMVLLMLKFSSCLIRGSQIVAFQGTDNTEALIQIIL